MQASQRILGLDAARAVMMILGVLLHSIIFSIFFIKIDSVEEFQTIMGSFFTIHTFRMPAFFLLAGYFAGVIFARRGRVEFLRNRLKRLGLVFLIFAPTIAPLTYLASASTQPPGLQHLWFLYYLILISAVYVLFTFLPAADWLENIQRRAGVWISDPRILWIAPLALTAVPGVLDESLRIRTSESLIPDFILLAFYGLFFSLGTLLHQAGGHGLESLSRRSPVLLVVGFVSAQIAYGWGINDTVGFGNRLAAFLATFYLAFGVIGIFIRVIKRENKIWTYLRQTSYWVYLVHLPIVFVILRFAAYLELPAAIAVPATFFMALALSLVGYEILVRRTPLSKLLN